ncbi:rhodanese-like domain-containing protein [Planomicrobium okeanokoites]|uniref:Rhodanese-like domain-containing protein n=1 Tax=Planomicrobium okeanokoites TaxID=244 RepID=A0ABV7KPY5_PLAOK|nr:rhodanese-like domain-containing protein [Planomicrobium okeanokoites]TAA71339.1 rhodanese-like domain-containing protein [Planomicrobium okeanokoites]
MKKITTDELQNRIESGEQLRIVDVREADEVAAGMIPGAVHIPLGEIADRAGEFESSQPYYLVCRSGARSGRATEFLQAQGIDVTNVEGGMLNWNGETQA